LNPSTRYGAQSDFFAREYVNSGRVDGWYRKGPSGEGKEEKYNLFKQLSEGEVKEEDDVKDGEYVKMLARDLIIKCEGVAKRVWKEAREGALPPFSDLDDDEGDSLREEQVKAAILSANLLPSVSSASSSDGLLGKDGSLSSQEDWEKVDGTV
jgi:hypothetical protein